MNEDAFWKHNIQINRNNFLGYFYNAGYLCQWSSLKSEKRREQWVYTVMVKRNFTPFLFYYFTYRA